MAMPRPQNNLFVGAKSLPYLPPKINFKNLDFLKNKDIVATLIRVIDELEKQRQGTIIEKDKRYRKNLLENVIEADLLPIIKRHSLMKIKKNYYLLYDGVKKEADIGNGTYGCVKYGINILTEELVAVKIMTESNISAPEEVETSGKIEAKRLAKVGDLIGAFPSFSPTKKYQYHIVQKLARSCTLEDFIRGTADVYERLHVFLQICKAVNALHERGMIHGDLSIYNIIYNPADGSVKLIDFGKACEVPPHSGTGFKQDGWSNAHPDRLHDQAPETVAPNGLFTKEADIFNLGRMMAYTFRLLDPDTHQLPKSMHAHLYRKTPHAISDYELRSSIFLLTRKMLEPNASNRPTLNEIMLEVEKLQRLVSYNCDARDVREIAGLVNLKKFYDYNSKEIAINHLLTFLKQKKITRVILVDPCHLNINDVHLKLMQTLEKENITVNPKVYFGSENYNDMLNEHFKTFGMVFKYYYYDFKRGFRAKTDCAIRLETYNNRLALLHSKVIKLKLQKRLLKGVVSPEIKNEVKELNAECDALTALANELGQTTILLTKLKKNLKSIRRPVPKLIFFPKKKNINLVSSKSKQTIFYPVSRDGFSISVYFPEPPQIKMINCIQTKAGCVSDAEQIYRYRGAVQPASNLSMDVNYIESLSKDAKIIPPTKPCDNDRMIDAAIAGEIAIVLQYLNENCNSLIATQKVSATLNLALQWAAFEGHYQIVRLLTDTLGVDVNHRVEGDPPICNAAFKGYTDIVKFFSSRPAVDINLSNIYAGENALTIAAEQGHHKVVKVLIAAGANVNHTNKEGTNALLSAAAYGHTKVIVELLKAPNLDLTRKSASGLTALEVAKKKNHIDIVYLLSNTPEAQKTAPTVRSS